VIPSKGLNMDSAELKEQIYKAIEGRAGEFALIKDSVEKFIMAVLGDAKGVIKELPELNDALNLAIEIADDKTNTGLLDLIDANIAKMILPRIVNDKMKLWYATERAKLLESADNAGI